MHFAFIAVIQISFLCGFIISIIMVTRNPISFMNKAEKYLIKKDWRKNRVRGALNSKFTRKRKI